MLERLRKTLGELDRSIFVGERYERNMRGIEFAALLIVAVNVVTGCLNLLNGYYSAAVTSPMFILAGLVILYFVRVRKNRKGAVVTAFVAVVVIFTYGTFSVSHGFPIFWTLLLPLAFCYFADVKSGICLSLYFLVLYSVLFLTPLRNLLAVDYSEVIMLRFPLLYLADVVLTSSIMMQYHFTTLRQMDYASQLLESKEEADRANAAKSDFLANMSHEIRTPINAVLGMNEMILRECAQARRLPSNDSASIQPAFDAIGSYATDVQNAGNNLLSIINAILDFSKLEAGRMDVVVMPYRLSVVLGDLVNMAHFRTQEKDVELVVDVDETLPDELVGDEVHVRQVIANLLTNAVKYTERGNVTLVVRGTIEGERKPGQTIRLHVEVRDTGIGIRSEDLKMLFTKFQRFDLNRNSTIEGTGLGLAITQGLLDMMGGSVRVESTYGVGSTFVVDLPQTIASCEALGNFGAQHPNGALHATAYKETFRAPSARILVVDDTKMNLAVVTGLLKGTELQIHTAPSGAEAIELARDTPYDLILMDQRMPQMSGTETFHCIRRQEGGVNRDTPVVCLTADAIAGARERYLSEGFTDYLPKPVDGKALEQVLIRHLPPDKVVLVPTSDETEKTEGATEDGTLPDGSTEASSAKYAPLNLAGIDASTGLLYCGGDETLYQSLLEEYARGAEERIRDMERYREASDWINLSILAHALKSTSKTIGAEDLSKLAANMEQAANANDPATIDIDFPSLMTRYAEVVEAILRVFPSSDGSLANELTDGLFSGDEILEFAPGEAVDDDEILEFFPDEP